MLIWNVPEARARLMAESQTYCPEGHSLGNWKSENGRNMDRHFLAGLRHSMGGGLAHRAENPDHESFLAWIEHQVDFGTGLVCHPTMMRHACCENATSRLGTTQAIETYR